MKTEIDGVDWLLTGEPRPAQVEALARSYTGAGWRVHRDQPLPTAPPYPLPWRGGPIDGFGFFMQMRVGKTPTLLNEFMLFKRDYGLKKLFILSPNQYKYTWALEMEKFGVDVPVWVYESGTKKKFPDWANNNPECAVIANYEAMGSDDNMDIFREFIDDRTYFGADESVIIKGHSSKYTVRALEIGPQAAVTRPMTGKPTPQGPHDLYSQLRFARKLQGVNYYAFRGKFAEMGGFKSRKVIGVKNETELQALTHKSAFVARRQDWADVKDIDYELVSLQMTPRQKEAYLEMENEFMVWLDSGEMVSVDQAMAKHSKLQQISSGFIIDEHSRAHEIVPFESTPKFQYIKDVLENQLNSKLLIACAFNESLYKLKDSLGAYNPAVIAGKGHMRRFGLETDEEKRRFNEDPNCRVMVAQEKAVKYGHTLMGTENDPCLDLFFFENTYSLDDRSQTEERPQGSGQVGALHILDFYSSPVEKLVTEALQRKETLSDKIMGYYKND